MHVIEKQTLEIFLRKLLQRNRLAFLLVEQASYNVVFPYTNTYNR